MSAYDAAAWHDLFVAEAGAAAALAGLLFVAVSINLERILAYPALPNRAAAALATLVVALVVSTFALVPGQGDVPLGVELVAASAPTVLLLTVQRLRLGRSERQTRAEYATELTLLLIALVPFTVAGASLLAGGGGGLYWAVAALVGVFVVAAQNAWVLLVEIMR